MKKKNLFLIGIMAATGLLLATACGNSCDVKNQATAAADSTEMGNLKIAYVEIDSLMSQYQFCKDYSILMSKKGENIRTTLENKERTLRANFAAFQKKYESNGFTTRDEVEKVQMSLARQEQDLQALNERLTNEFAMEQAKFNEEMRDSIQSFLVQYNKDKKFDYIISKAGDNILLANKKLDITDEVVKGLNKRYKIKPEVAEKIGVK